MGSVRYAVFLVRVPSIERWLFPDACGTAVNSFRKRVARAARGFGLKGPVAAMLWANSGCPIRCSTGRLPGRGGLCKESIGLAADSWCAQEHRSAKVVQGLISTCELLVVW